MKQFTVLLAFVLLAVTALSAQEKSRSEAKPASAKIETTVVQVPTVICSSCVKTITKALKKVDGVKSTKIDLKKKTATIQFASSKVTVAEIEKAISLAGYDANDTKRDSTAYENLDECCKLKSK